MRISETRRPGAVSPRKELRSSGGFGFSVPAGRPDEIRGTAPGASLTAPASVLSLQEVGGGAEGRRRATERAHDMLDELEKLRLAMVEGWLCERALKRLATLADAGGLTVDDGRLAGVLRDIEVRVAVEIAKREVDDGS